METLADIHPIAVHFPVALLIVYILIEVIGLFYNNSKLQYTSLLLISFGVLGGIVSVISGNMEYQQLQTHPHITKLHLFYIEGHSDLASLTMWYFVGILILKLFILIKRKYRSFHHLILIIMSLFGTYLLYKTAQLGGILVYKYGIGTDIIN